MSPRTKTCDCTPVEKSPWATIPCAKEPFSIVDMPTDPSGYERAAKYRRRYVVDDLANQAVFSDFSDFHAEGLRLLSHRPCPLKIVVGHDIVR